MTMDGTTPHLSKRTFLTGPSLACDLTWLLWVALKPEWRDNHPLASEILGKHEDLVDRIRTFWADLGPGVCFTEVQILAHHAGALGETSPTALWAALEAAVPTVPMDLPLESESAEDRTVFLQRLERLKSSPSLVRSYLEMLRQVWDLVDEVWQAALPTLDESGQRVVTQLEAGRELEDLVGEHCESFLSWLPDINAHIDAGQPLLVVPCLFFGKSLYLEFPGLTLVGAGFRHNDAAAPRPNRSAGTAAQGGGGSHPPGASALSGGIAQHRRRSGDILRPGPTDRQHAREVVARLGPRAFRTVGWPPPAERRSRSGGASHSGAARRRRGCRCHD